MEHWLTVPCFVECERGQLLLIVAHCLWQSCQHIPQLGLAVVLCTDIWYTLMHGNMKELNQFFTKRIDLMVIKNVYQLYLCPLFLPLMWCLRWSVWTWVLLQQDFSVRCRGMIESLLFWKKPKVPRRSILALRWRALSLKIPCSRSAVVWITRNVEHKKKRISRISVCLKSTL